MRRALSSIRIGIAVLVTVGLGATGFVEARLRFSGTMGSPTYELEHKTEILNGIRQYPETVYSYFRQFPGRPREALWTLKVNDRYFAHWIAPSGVVWVMTSSMPGPGGGGRTWARDTTADLLGQFNVSSSGPTGTGNSASVDRARTTAETLGLGKAELLDVKFDNGGERRLILTSLREGEHVRTFEQDSPKGPITKPSILEEVLRSTDYQIPHAEMPLGDWSPLILWRASNIHGQDRVWFVPLRIAEYLRAGWALPLDQETELPNAPTLISKTPGQRVLMWDFHLPNADRAVLHVYDGAMKLIKTFDLVQEGKYGSAYEANLQLLYGDVRLVTYPNPTPISQVAADGLHLNEQLEFSDRNGNRFALSLCSSDYVHHTARLERFSGLAARRPKEMVRLGMTPSVEKKFDSPNGLFTLRARKFDWPTFSNSVMTLLYHAVQPDGSKIEVELWSEVVPEFPSEVRVTDAGITHGLIFERFQNGDTGKEEPYAVWRIVGISGRPIAGLDLIDKTWYGSFEIAKSKLHLAELDISDSGKHISANVEGLEVLTWTEERLRIPLPNGQTREALLAKQGLMPFMGMTWKP